MKTAARNEMPAGPDKMIQQNLNLDRVGGTEVPRAQNIPVFYIGILSIR